MRIIIEGDVESIIAFWKKHIKELCWEVLNEADEQGFFDSDQSAEATKE